MKFEYPNKKDPSKDGQCCLTAGFYPVGALNTWHGGVHIEGKGAQIYAIADGEIIAYKIASKYLEDKAVKKDKEQTTFYSDSFVLIRHEYTYDKDKVFTFYSLYNHLQIKDEIKKGTCPDFLNRFKKIKEGKESQYLRGDIGANLRDVSNKSTVLGVIPYGSEVEVLEKKEKQYFSVKTFSLWEVTSSTKETITIELSLKEKSGVCWNSAQQFNEIEFKAGTVVRKNILSKEDGLMKGSVLFESIEGKEIGVLFKDMEVEILEQSTQNSEWFKIKVLELWVESEDSTATKIIYEKASGEYEGWCKNNNSQFDGFLKSEYDKIVSVSIPVKAGETIGYSGKYESGNGYALQNYHTAHVEVFSNDNVPAFLHEMLQKVTPDNKVYCKEKIESYFSIGKTIESYKYTKGEASDKNLSPYDWRSFGFSLYEGDPDGYFMNSNTPLLQEVLRIVDTNLDGELSEEEFNRARKSRAVNDHLSKMICVHRSEWTYQNTALSKLKNDAGVVLDKCIQKVNPKTSKEKQAYLDLKEQIVSRFEKKAKNLSFLSNISFPSLFSSLPDFCFYYFHPFAFVEQMRRMKIESKYLTIDKAIYSATAIRNNIDNNVDKDEHYDNIMHLGIEIYDLLYEFFQGNISIESCYRNSEVNKLVGGSATSQHCFGQAIDLKAKTPYSNREIIKYILENNIDYDQIIWEYGNNTNPQWVHISVKQSNNRKKLTQATKSDTQTIYSTLDLKKVNLE